MRTLSPWIILAVGLGSSMQVSAEAARAAGSTDRADSADGADSAAEEELVAPEDADHELPGSEDGDVVAAAEEMVSVDGAAAAGAEERPECEVAPVTLRRFGLSGDPVIVRLTDCAGAPNPDAVPLLRPLVAPLAATGDDAEALLNPELLARIQHLVDRFKASSVEIVSGYRPGAHAGSRHHSGDALDLRIDGVDNLALSEFARTLDATGVGYYPNSTFVHIDVREAPAYWVDKSRPGERPKYVRKEALAPVAAEQVDVAPKEIDVAPKKADPMSAAKTAPSEDRLRDAHMVEVASKTAGEDISGEDPSPVRNADAEPAQHDAKREASRDDPRLDPDVRAVMDRALAVMNRELGTDPAPAAD
jgi:hypothetical protein